MRSETFSGIESVKWLGVIAMIYDHLEVFAGWLLPFAAGIGGLAFPLFAVGLAAALADATLLKMRSISKRLLLIGLVAQVAVIFVRDPLPLNVLFSFCAGLGLYVAIKEKSFLFAIVAAVVATLSEFSWPGALVILAALAHYRDGASVGWMYAASVLLFPFNEMQLTAPLGVAVALWLVVNGPAIDRKKHAFYPIYVLQYPVLRFL